jgi:hypothetical protein
MENMVGAQICASIASFFSEAIGDRGVSAEWCFLQLGTPLSTATASHDAEKDGAAKA